MFHSSTNWQISTSTVQRRLCESGLHGQIAAKKPTLKDTNKTKRLACVKKHKQWTLDRWKCVLWSGVQIWDFLFQLPCLCETRCGWTDDLHMCISQRKAWMRWCYGVGVLCWWHWDLFTIQGTLNQHGYHSILQRYAIPSGLGLVGLSFVFQQDNDPTHLQAV